MADPRPPHGPDDRCPGCLPPPPPGPGDLGAEHAAPAHSEVLEGWMRWRRVGPLGSGQPPAPRPPRSGLRAADDPELMDVLRDLADELRRHGPNAYERLVQWVVAVLVAALVVLALALGGKDLLEAALQRLP